MALAKIVANLHSQKPALSKAAMAEIRTPPTHYTRDPKFNPASASFYSKGINVSLADGGPWYEHSGMTQHCGGIIGHSSGYQYVAVSNWNNSDRPYVDVILGRALREALSKLG